MKSKGNHIPTWMFWTSLCTKSNEFEPKIKKKKSKTVTLKIAATNDGITDSIRLPVCRSDQLEKSDSLIILF